MKQNKIPRNEYIIKPKGKIDPYKDDVQYGKSGQLRYPYQVTKIPGDTMSTEGYGNIPLWTVPDVGPPRMVYPNTGNQFFAGANNFTEYPMKSPMARYGGSSDMYPFGGIHTKTDTHMSKGGWLDAYEPGGEKPWGDMTAKERAAYLDAKEANAKAENTSRKQATKEHYQDYVKDSMKKTLEHPMFNTAQYFTPEGMAIGAIKGLANVGPDVAKGDYSAAAFDALTALPAVAPAVKNAYRVNPWAFKPNPEAYYRMVGKEGIKDATKSGIIRANQKIPLADNGEPFGGMTTPEFDVPYFSKSRPFDGREYGKTPWYGQYEGPGMIEVNNKDYFKALSPRADYIGLPKSTIKTNDDAVKLYEQHWLQGYKKISKELPGSPNTIENIDPFLHQEPAKNSMLWGLNPMNYFGEELPSQMYRKIGSRKGIKSLLEKKGATSPTEPSTFWSYGKKPDEGYSGVFALGYDVNHPNATAKRFSSFMGPRGRHRGVSPYDIQNKLMSNIPLEDEALNLYRRLPFSRNYKAIPKDEIATSLLANPTLAGLQNLSEKAVRAGIYGSLIQSAGNSLEGTSKNPTPLGKPLLSYITDYINNPQLNVPNKKEGGWLDEYQDAGSTGVRPIQDNTRVVQTNFPKNLDELKAEQKKEINYQARKQAEQLMAINNAKNKEAQYQKDLKEGKVKKRISFMNYTPEEEVGIKGELARLRTIDNQRSTQEKLDDASLDVLTSIVPELPLLKYLKPAASLNKSSKLLKAAPENAFTYRGVVEPFEGATQLVRDEADAYYNFLQGRQNPKLAGQWKNEYKEFKKQYPVTSKSSTGIIEKPSDPEYYKNFLVNGKPIQEKPSWLLHEPQSNTLQIKSTMTGSPLEKQLSKTGEINVNNIKTHIGKAEVGQQDKFIIDKVLNEKFAGKTKIDYNDFRKAVSEELVPLEKSFSNQYNEYGIDNIGYNNKKSGDNIPYIKESIEALSESIKDFEKYKNNPEGFLELYKGTDYASTPIAEVKRHIKETLEGDRTRLINSKKELLRQEEMLKSNLTPKENTSIVYGNKSKFGKGSIDHFTDEGTLGHARILVSKEEPDVMHVLEQQSDFYQKKGQGKTILEKLKGDKTNNTLAREQELIGRAKSRLEENKKILKNLKYKKDNNLLHNGNNVHDSEISQLQGMVDGEQKAVSLREGNLKNWEQKEFLGKTHQERLLQENVLHAVEQGKSKMRYPTSETAAKIQGYTQKDYGVIFKELEDLRNGNISDVTKLSRETKVAITGQGNTSLLDITTPTPTPRNYKDVLSDLDKNKDFVKFLENKKGIKGYDPEHQTILKKYDDTPKMIKKVLGKEAKVVTDPKGNTWYEFDIPDAAKKGKFEIKAFALGGGWLDDEEFRRGGQKGLKKYTSKNIQSSVNDIMLRNETLFGPAGKRRYKPGLKYKDGGWLDNLLD